MYFSRSFTVGQLVRGLESKLPVVGEKNNQVTGNLAATNHSGTGAKQLGLVLE